MTAPFTIGLTGSIGMGKSTTAAMFSEAGCAVWDADATVHKLYDEGGAGVSAIAQLRPDAVIDGAVSKERLKLWIERDQTALKRIEAAIHPLVAEDRRRFCQETEADIAVFDIPLLFEGGMADQFDLTVVVSAGPEMQRTRVLERPGMTEAQFEAIHAKQLPDAEKRKRAGHVIETKDHNSARVAVLSLVRDIRSRHA